MNSSKLQTHNNNNNKKKKKKKKLQSIINVKIHLSYFLYFERLNFVFSSCRDVFVSRIKKIL